jgi:hypothetical protein
MKKCVCIVLILIPQICTARNNEQVLVISEIMFSGSKDWVEIYCVDDGNNMHGLQLRGYYIDDMDGEKDKIIGSCTIRTGEVLILYYGEEYDKDDTCGKNGRINLFTTKRFITSTTDQIIFYTPDNKIIDAVCWANCTPSSYEQEDMDKIMQLEEWTSEPVDSTEIDEACSIVRKKYNIDTNSKYDWQISAVPTPGVIGGELYYSNQMPKINILEIINRTFVPLDNEEAVIKYYITKDGYVSSRIYDINGKLVKILFEMEYKPGYKIDNIVWDGRNNNNIIMPIGIYMCYIEVVNNHGSTCEKVVLILAERL